MASSRLAVRTERTAGKGTKVVAHARIVRGKQEVPAPIVKSLLQGDTDGMKPSQTAGWRTKRQSRIRKEPAMAEATTFVGLDVHKRWINVAVLLPGNRPHRVADRERGAPSRKMLKRVAELAPGDVRYCYEAGPCGYALQRQIIASWSDASCMLVAPSLIPRKPGERIKTDRRDARKLAALFRAGLLTEVQPSPMPDEAARDLSRAREDLREDLVRARHRLGKFLLRRAITFTPGKRAWTLAHRRWLLSLRFDNPPPTPCSTTTSSPSSRSKSASRSSSSTRSRHHSYPRYAKAVATLRCFRSFETITAVGLAESSTTSNASPASPTHVLRRPHPRRAPRGTPTGRHHQDRQQPRPTTPHRGRLELPTPAPRRNGSPQPPTGTISQDDRPRRSSHAEAPSPFYEQMSHPPGVLPQKAVVAMARELAGFVWAALSPLAQQAPRTERTRDSQNSRTADEDRHDPENPRRSFATRLVRDSRHKIAVTSRRNTVMRLCTDHSA